MKLLINRLFNLILNRKPFFYAATYLLLIPTFAFIYSFLPYHFYHSTTKYEYSIMNPKADEILNNLKVQIQKNYQTTQKELPQNQNERILDIDEISVNSLKYENDKFYFKLCYSEFFKVNEKDADYSYNHSCHDLSVPRKVFMKTINPETNEQKIYREVLDENPNKTPDSPYFKNRINDFFQAENFHLPVLLVEKSLDDELNEFAMTIYGFPSSYWENYWRMFYFSAVTLTTLGFGDIVPVTNEARITISIEAILGIVIIGLFLNALSKRSA